MNFNQLEAEIAVLLNGMNDQPGDLHEFWHQLQIKLNQMTATGMPLPEDLAALKQMLETDFGEARRRAAATAARYRVTADRAARLAASCRATVCSSTKVID